MSWLSKGLKKIEGAIADVIPHQSAAEKRMKSDAISSYYQQKESAMAEQSKINAAKDLESRRIQEKQIRSMRRRYKSSGFLQPMSGDSATQDKMG